MLVPCRLLLTFLLYERFVTIATLRDSSQNERQINQIHPLYKLWKLGEDRFSSEHSEVVSLQWSLLEKNEKKEEHIARREGRTQAELKKLKSGLVVSYDLRSKNGEGPILPGPSWADNKMESARNTGFINL